MATKVDPSSSVEPHRGLSSVSASTSSSVSGGRPKISMFGTKSGFVIPKNKLTGSLVPKFRGGTKADSGNTQIKEESSRRVQRKTKWGPDLTQDAAVRKARALAYQTRVEQITQQQKSGALEIEDNEGSQLPELDSGQHSDSDRVNQKAKMYELLELEKRELIGEILRLNSNYKPPSDYKPLLKEGKVPIPVKAHPGYNFIGLLMGPESNTQKRLEEETGAKIRVYGTKTNTLEKREITQSDIAEAQGAYEELYVNISADSYEKVDAAVSLIELLVTPVSVDERVEEVKKFNLKALIAQSERTRDYMPMANDNRLNKGHEDRAITEEMEIEMSDKHLEAMEVEANLGGLSIEPYDLLKKFELLICR